MALLNQLNSRLHRFISEMYPQTRSTCYYTGVAQTSAEGDEEDNSNEQSSLLGMQEDSITHPTSRHRRSVCSVDTLQTIDEETEMENQKLLEKSS
jgi:hypothetical protein